MNRQATELGRDPRPAPAAERFETVIVGGGQAGLAVGFHLARRGRRFVILDAGRRVGDAWRQRWDSLRLFTPARYDGLPGMPFPAPAFSYPGKDQVADYLEAYALDRAGTPGMRDAGRLMALGMAAIPPADLERIAVPTTLIWGRDDRQVRLRVAEAASARYGWPLRVIEGAADDPAMERPGAFLAALRAALGGA